VTRKIEGIEGQLIASRIQTIDPTIKWETTLGVVKSLPKFISEITQYVGWRDRQKLP